LNGDSYTPRHTVITSFSPQGYEQYGKGFIETFRKHWPREVNLLCAWEGVCPHPMLNGFDLLQEEPCKNFIARHKDNLISQGKKDAPPAQWAPKAKRLGYSFRHDAYKFARKVFAVAAAARYVEGGRLFWIDADVVTHSDVPAILLDSLLPDTVSLCYLWRRQYPSELGFVGYNLHRKETREFIAAYLKQYTSDEFLKDMHWDDCSQFDYLIRKRVPHAKLITHSRPSQPFDDSVLGRYMRHNKGRRKLG
jgi:hypothetical protein